MAEITIPTIKQSRAEFRLVRKDQVNQLMSGSDVVTAFPRAVWAQSIPLVIQTEDGGRVWSARLAQLSSLGNYFKARPPGYYGAQYSATTLQVNGSGQLGLSLDIKGASAGVTVLRIGEFFEVNGEVKIVTDDCTANGSGLATVQFEPALRSSPSNSSNLETQNPQIKWRLRSPEGVWSIVPGRFYEFNLEVVEAVYA